MKSPVLVLLLLSLHCNARDPDIDIRYLDGNQLLFHSKGQLVNRISFVHVSWTMDLEAPLSFLKNVTLDLEARFRSEMFKSGRAIKQFDLGPNITSVWNDKTLQDLFSEKHLDGAFVCLTLLEMFYRIYHRLDSLLRSVPDKFSMDDDSLLHQRVKKSVDDDSFSFTDDPFQMKCLNPGSKNRTKREILGGIALGLSTWNSYRISTIESSLANLSSKYNVLVDSVTLLGNRHNQLVDDVELMKRLIHIIASNNFRKMLASSVSASNQLQNTIEDVVSIVTTGRQRRISSRLINGDSLMELFINLKKKAKELDSELLLVQPSDLYDVEASYGYSQSGLCFKIYAHVPLASKSETLSLFEHIPFPMAYQSLKAGATITPDTGLDKFLAVLPSETAPDGHKYRVLNEAELQNCFRLRNYFLCSGRNMLRLDFKSSCIGSLWMKDHDLVIRTCKMKIDPLQEIVVKTASRQWLVFSPNVTLKSVTCGKNKNIVQSLRFERQTLVSLVENCEVTLSRYILSTDTNVMIDFKIKAYEWRYFGNIFSSSTSVDDDINKIVDRISSSKEEYDLSHLKHFFTVSSDIFSDLWKAISNLDLFSWFGNIYMFFLYAALIWLCVIALSKGWFLKCCFRRRTSRHNSSIIRPVRSRSVVYSATPLEVRSPLNSESSLPPPYTSVVAANSPTAPIITVENGATMYPPLSPLVTVDEGANNMYPSLSSVVTLNDRANEVYPSLSSFPVEPNGTEKCLINFNSKISNSKSQKEDFICHHHDPINGCNGSFKIKKFVRGQSGSSL